MSGGLPRARELAAELGQWAAGGIWVEPESPEATRWAIQKADGLISELMWVDRAAEAHRIWSLPGHPFAWAGGHCVHVRDCFYVNQSAEATEAAGHRPLTRSQAEACLRKSHDHRRCRVCAPDIPAPPWVRVQTAGGQIRWRLTEAGP